MENIEHNLAFSFSDKDFTDFLPQDSRVQLYSQWADFNIHDPGVTTYEALNFSFVDLSYRYERPIQNIMQGRIRNAFDSWSISDLRPFYAVTSNDYRAVLASHNLAVNAAVFPAKKANIAQGKYRPMSLLNIDITDDNCDPQPLGDREMIKYRALGEYFNRQTGQSQFLRCNTQAVKVRIEVQFKQREDNQFNRAKLMCAVESFLLPQLKETNFRYVENIEELILSEYFGPPLPSDNTSVMCAENMAAESYRKYIVVSELIEVIEQMDFLKSVNVVEIGLLDGDYESIILNLKEYCFTKLEEFIINNEAEPISSTQEYCNYEADQTGLNSDLIPTKFQDLGKFHSIQQSFPNNYEIGKNVQNQTSSELGETANFRTYLYFFDQIRSDILAQLGTFPRVFTVNSRAGRVQFRSLRKYPLYRDLNIKFGKCDNDELSKVRIEAFKSLDFREKRLNYLLALNGWTIDEEVPVPLGDENLLRIKRQFLDLVHNEDAFNIERRKGRIYNLSERKNILFSSKSLVSLKNKIRVILQDQIKAVRILEHVFLQPVWDRKDDFDFDITVFLFPKEGQEQQISEDAYQKYAHELVRSYVPAHIVVNVAWCIGEQTVSSLDAILNAAYPPLEIFYFDNKISAEQRVAMELLMTNWIN